MSIWGAAISVGAGLLGAKSASDSQEAAARKAEQLSDTETQTLNMGLDMRQRYFDEYAADGAINDRYIGAVQDLGSENARNRIAAQGVADAYKGLKGMKGFNPNSGMSNNALNQAYRKGAGMSATANSMADVQTRDNLASGLSNVVNIGNDALQGVSSNYNTSSSLAARQSINDAQADTYLPQALGGLASGIAGYGGYNAGMAMNDSARSGSLGVGNGKGSNYANNYGYWDNNSGQWVNPS